MINNAISEFENLLICCKFLEGLIIDISDAFSSMFNWDKLFEILTKSSPIGLFRFKFLFCVAIKVESLKLFFDNWKEREPILLELINNNDHTVAVNVEELQKLEDLTKKYKEEGIIKQYSIGVGGYIYDNFEWISYEYDE